MQRLRRSEVARDDGGRAEPSVERRNDAGELWAFMKASVEGDAACGSNMCVILYALLTFLECLRNRARAGGDCRGL